MSSADPSGWRGFWHRLVAVSERGLVFVMALSSALVQVPPESSTGLLAVSSGFIRSHIYLLPLAVVTDAALRLLQRYLRPAGLVQALLDGLSSTVYQGRAGKTHHHRATLFRHGWCWRKWPFNSGWGRWPWSGWLRIHARSGHTTQHSSTVFYANQSDPEHVEGVAGETWAEAAVYMVSDLPELKGQPADMERSVREYARQGSVEPEWVNKRLTTGQRMARSICGLPVESRGAMWGVIVLDSADPEGLERETVLRIYKPISSILDQLIARRLV